MNSLTESTPKSPASGGIFPKKRACFHTLGCKVNAYETEAMAEQLREAGYEIVDFEEPAEVCVINTCSVTATADAKSRQLLHRARALHPEAVVVAAGCYVQTAQALLSADPAVDILLGSNCRNRLAESLRSYEAAGGQKAPMTVMDPDAALSEYEDLHISSSGRHTRAFVKVQDGCNQFCTYCIIPYARGRVRSRRIKDVCKELSRLAQNGCREAVLTGIHVSSYDGARPEEMGDAAHPLVALLRACAEVDGIERLRLSSLEPRMITEMTARQLAKIPGLCPHFHLSLQSGCDATLSRMGRRYTTAEYEAAVGYLRQVFSKPAITTDVIVGFPGETQEAFAESAGFIRRMNFYETHVFAYSPRPGTKAAAMPDDVSKQEKRRRSRELIALGQSQSARFRRSFAGEEREVLFEQLVTDGTESFYTGYTPEYIRVAVPAAGDDLRGQILRGRLREGDTDRTLMFDLP